MSRGSKFSSIFFIPFSSNDNGIPRYSAYSGGLLTLYQRHSTEGNRHAYYEGGLGQISHWQRSCFSVLHPVPAVETVSLSSTACKNPSCSFFAAEGNGQRWVMHSLFPVVWTERGSRRRIGGDMASSACNSSVLIAARINKKPLLLLVASLRRYSNHGMMHLPSDPSDCAVAVRVLGISASVRQRIIKNLRNF